MSPSTTANLRRATDVRRRQPQRAHRNRRPGQERRFEIAAPRSPATAPTPRTPHPHTPSKALRTKYIAKYGSSLNEDISAAVGVAHAYDLVSILAAAVRKANSTDVNAVRSAMENITHHNGAVKNYAPPFTPDQHDALFAPDYFMATFDNDGHIITVDASK